VLCQPIDHGTEVEGGGADPISQRAAVKLDARAGKDLALTIQRQMVRVFADQHMRQGALSG